MRSEWIPFCHLNSVERFTISIFVAYTTPQVFSILLYIYLLGVTDVSAAGMGWLLSTSTRQAFIVLSRVERLASRHRRSKAAKCYIFIPRLADIALLFAYEVCRPLIGGRGVPRWPVLPVRRYEVRDTILSNDWNIIINAAPTSSCLLIDALRRLAISSCHCWRYSLICTSRKYETEYFMPRITDLNVGV